MKAPYEIGPAPGAWNEQLTSETTGLGLEIHAQVQLIEGKALPSESQVPALLTPVLKHMVANFVGNSESLLIAGQPFPHPHLETDIVVAGLHPRREGRFPPDPDADRASDRIEIDRRLFDTSVAERLGRALAYQRLSDHGRMLDGRLYKCHTAAMNLMEDPKGPISRKGGH